MARSVGEAIANGLDAGFRLGADVNNQRIQQEREARNADRQARLDDAAATASAAAAERTASKDVLSALDEQGKLLAAEGQAAIDSGAPMDEAAQRSYTERVRGLQQARSKHLSKVSGFDLDAERKAASDDIKQIEATTDVSTLKPGQLTRAMTVATNRNPADYVRPEGGMAPIEQAGNDLLEGLKTGNRKQMLAGINVLYAPSLRSGIGEDSPHGGKIVGKQIVDLHPDPKSDPQNPRVVPMLRVYVSNGSRPAPSGDLAHPSVTPEEAQGAPVGATGHYDAPLTEDRSSRSDAAVKSIGIDEAMNFVGQNLHVVELLNDPKALAKLKEDQASGWDPRQYLAALSAAGARRTPPKVTQHVIPAGASLSTTATKADGTVETTVTQGNPKPERPPTAAVSTMQAKLDAVDADPSLSPREREIEKRAIRSGIKPGRYTGDGGGPARGLSGAKGGGGKDDDKAVGRQLQAIKEQRLALERKKEVYLREYQADIKDASSADRAKAKATYDRRTSAVEADDADLKKRMTALADRIDQRATGSPTLGGLGSAKPAPALSKAGAGIANKYGF